MHKEAYYRKRRYDELQDRYYEDKFHPRISGDYPEDYDRRKRKEERRRRNRSKRPRRSPRYTSGRLGRSKSKSKSKRRTPGKSLTQKKPYRRKKLEEYENLNDDGLLESVVLYNAPEESLVPEDIQQSSNFDSYYIIRKIPNKKKPRAQGDYTVVEIPPKEREMGFSKSLVKSSNKDRRRSSFKNSESRKRNNKGRSKSRRYNGDDARVKRSARPSGGSRRGSRGGGRGRSVYGERERRARGEKSQRRRSKSPRYHRESSRNRKNSVSGHKRREKSRRQKSRR